MPDAPAPAVLRPLTIRGRTLKNRVVISPMCQHAGADGFAADWHLVHYGKFAPGGAALVLTESAAVCSGSRVGVADLGIWSDAHVPGLKRIADFVHANGALMGVQIAHSGRKAWSHPLWHGGQAMRPEEIDAAGGPWRRVGPSPIAASAEWTVPGELSAAEIDDIRRAHVEAARRADAAGMDVLELHYGHGCLAASFLSPLSNRRTDGYGGDRAGRMRLALEIARDVRAAWPADKPLFARLSCVDGAEGGWGMDDTVVLAAALKAAGGGRDRLLLGRAVRGDAPLQRAARLRLPGPLRRTGAGRGGRACAGRGADHHAGAGRGDRGRGARRSGRHRARRARGSVLAREGCAGAVGGRGFRRLARAARRLAVEARAGDAQAAGRRGRGGRGVIARFGLLRKAAGLPEAEFDRHWREAHGPLAARMPGLRAYQQHRVVNRDQFGISAARGAWELDGLSELHFDDLGAMRAAIASPAFGGALKDEAAFLGDVHLVACETHEVVPFDAGDGPCVTRLTLLRRKRGMSVAEFRHEWLEVHAAMVRDWPDVPGYAQNVVVDRWHGGREESAPYDAVPVDGIVAFRFRDEATAARLYASEIVARTQVHAKSFLEEITPFFVETRRIA
ncbi:EthD family reductase [Rhodovulum sp. DZ06]|uniref:EthD family reductase n=1 Tax=Rhodovulum sp. DZ06 TaxID=3425126 RepID=UPI003D33A955